MKWIKEYQGELVSADPVYKKLSLPAISLQTLLLTVSEGIFGNACFICGTRCRKIKPLWEFLIRKVMILFFSSLGLRNSSLTSLKYIMLNKSLLK